MKNEEWTFLLSSFFILQLLASAHRRNERNLIAVTQHGLQRAELLVDRVQQPAAVAAEPRVTRDQQFPTPADRRTIMEFDALLGVPDNIAVSSEIAYSHFHL